MAEGARFLARLAAVADVTVLFCSYKFSRTKREHRGHARFRHRRQVGRVEPNAGHGHVWIGSPVNVKTPRLAFARPQPNWYAT